MRDVFSKYMDFALKLLVVRLRLLCKWIANVRNLMHAWINALCSAVEVRVERSTLAIVNSLCLFYVKLHEQQCRMRSRICCQTTLKDPQAHANWFECAKCTSSIDLQSSVRFPILVSSFGIFRLDKCSAARAQQGERLGERPKRFWLVKVGAESGWWRFL